MSRIPRGGRARTLIAIVALTLLVSGAGIAVWPRADAGNIVEAVDPHAEHLSVQVSGSDIGASIGTSTVVPLESDSVGNSPQTSLAAAAGSAPLATGSVPMSGMVAIEQSGTKAAPSTTAVPARSRAGLGKPRPDVKPSDVLDPEAALGGCDAAYGADGQCLPVTPPSLAEHAAEMADAGLDPSSMDLPWTCTELREYFADGIAVRVPGVDPDGLDGDSDGMACEPD